MNIPYKIDSFTHKIIIQENPLKKIITELQGSKHLGVDTEFIRESTYYPILALLQISTKKSIFCIDVLGSFMNTKHRKYIKDSKYDDTRFLTYIFKQFLLNIPFLFYKQH